MGVAWERTKGVFMYDKQGHTLASVFLPSQPLGFSLLEMGLRGCFYLFLFRSKYGGSKGIFWRSD